MEVSSKLHALAAFSLGK